jgi:hypothetical protein
MQITIEGESLVDIEEKIIATAREIEDRRMLLSQGCTCDLNATAPNRCTGPFIVCNSRRIRYFRGAPAIKEQVLAQAATLSTA